MSSENLSMILLSMFLYSIIGSVISLSSLKRLISSSRSLNKNASFSCTSLLFFSTKTKTCQVYHSQVIQQSHLLFAPFFQRKFNIAGIMVIYISCKKVMSFISYFYVKSCCSFMKLCCWIL